jgi:hypothetical protein
MEPRYSNFIHRLPMEGGCSGLLLGSIGPRLRSLLLYIDMCVTFSFPDDNYTFLGPTLLKLHI